MSIMDPAGAILARRLPEHKLLEKSVVWFHAQVSLERQTGNKLLDVQQIVMLLGPLHKNVVDVFNT